MESTTTQVRGLTEKSVPYSLFLFDDDLNGLRLSSLYSIFIPIGLSIEYCIGIISGMSKSTLQILEQIWNGSHSIDRIKSPICYIPFFSSLQPWT